MWEELDQAERMWTLPGDRAKNGEPNCIPLSAAMANRAFRDRRHARAQGTEALI